MSDVPQMVIALVKRFERVQRIAQHDLGRTHPYPYL